MPHLQYWITNADGTKSPHRAVAEHIRQAQDDPNSTFPPKPDGSPKKIPGKYTGEVDDLTILERIPPDSQQAGENERAKNAACAHLGRPPADENGVEYQCDEYPFASTWQGAGSAARSHPDVCLNSGRDRAVFARRRPAPSFGADHRGGYDSLPSRSGPSR